MIYYLVIGVIVLFLIIFLLKYLNGDFSILRIEEISNKRYEVTAYNGARSHVIIIVQKIYYRSGKIKYKTIEIDC